MVAFYVELGASRWICRKLLSFGSNRIAYDIVQTCRWLPSSFFNVPNTVACLHLFWCAYQHDQSLINWSRHTNEEKRHKIIAGIGRAWSNRNVFSLVSNDVNTVVPITKQSSRFPLRSINISNLTLVMQLVMTYCIPQRIGKAAMLSSLSMAGLKRWWWSMFKKRTPT